ncbi:fibronectin type III domain-containing protein [Alteromonas gilva]|uniref:Fibronectin type III domain-containing protein n=1 Tax=Alteromonas gilva TaxID=2987522 RepID=A0ABT5L5V6_9ALTE|nr:fibronectin type III domain-containing protein [Alteromonas gilva]MDC8832440.1 fibronectin type III domain-containing protein [Alteromonas gilva]
MSRRHCANQYVPRLLCFAFLTFLSTLLDPDPEPQPDALAAPGNLTVSQSGSTVTLSWTDNSTSELGFYVERGLKQKGQVSFQRIAVAGADTTFTTDNADALASGNYSYRVQAYNNAEVSGYSNTVSVRLK